MRLLRHVALLAQLSLAAAAVVPAAGHAQGADAFLVQATLSGPQPIRSWQRNTDVGPTAQRNPSVRAAPALPVFAAHMPADPGRRGSTLVVGGFVVGALAGTLTGMGQVNEQNCDSCILPINGRVFTYTVVGGVSGATVGWMIHRWRRR